MKKAIITISLLLGLSFTVTTEPYIFNIPGGQTVIISLPAACIEYQQRIPEISDNYVTQSINTADAYFHALLKVEAELINNAESYLNQFPFDFRILQKEKEETDLKMDQLDEITSQLEAFDQDTADYNDFMAYLQMANEAITMLAEVAQPVYITDTSTLAKVSPDQQQQLFIGICRTAFQKACWYSDPKYQKDIKLITERNETTKAEFYLGDIMREAAIVLMNNNDKP